jgi:hypothetical protein
MTDDGLDTADEICPRCRGPMPENFRAGIEDEDGSVEVFCMRCATKERPEVLGVDSRMLVGMIGMMGETLGLPMPSQTQELMAEAVHDAVRKASKK